jgi:Flp pilus assembly pilin Flp
MLCAEVALETREQRGFARAKKSVVTGVFQQESTRGKGRKNRERINAMTLMRRFWIEDDGQDIAEYAVMLAVILVLVVGTIRLVGSNANNAFSSVASSLQ